MKSFFRLFFLASLMLTGCDDGGRYTCPKSSDLINLQNIQSGTTFVADGQTWAVHHAQGYIALKAIEQLQGPEKITDASKLTALGLSKGQFACQYTRTIFGKVYAVLYLRPRA